MWLTQVHILVRNPGIPFAYIWQKLRADSMVVHFKLKYLSFIFFFSYIYLNASTHLFVCFFKISLKGLHCGYFLETHTKLKTLLKYNKKIHTLSNLILLTRFLLNILVFWIYIINSRKGSFFKLVNIIIKIKTTENPQDLPLTSEYSSWFSLNYLKFENKITLTIKI